MNNRDSLWVVLKHYVGETFIGEFTRTADGFDADYSKTRAAIFGTNSEELKKELDKFRNFPGSFTVLTPDSRSYNIDSIFHNGRGKKDYIYKQDALNIVMEKLLPFIKSEDKLENETIEDLFTLYLKCKEEKLERKYRLTLYYDRTFDALRSQMEKTLKTKKKTLKPDNADQVIFECIKERLKRSCPGIDVFEMGLILGNLKREIERKASKELIQFYHRIESFVHVSEKFIDDRKDYFDVDHPNELTVRGFRGFTTFFYLVCEVFEWLKLQELRSEKLRTEFKQMMDTDPLATIGEDSLKYKLEEHERGNTVNLNVPRVPILVRRTTRRPVPIPSFEEQHCLLAIDFVIRLLKVLITEESTFLRIEFDDKSWDTVVDVFYSTLSEVDDSKFLDETNIPYFIDYSKCVEAEKSMRTKLNSLFLMETNDVDYVPFVGDRGFTDTDLKKKITELGLDKWFPYFTRYVESVHKALKTKRKVISNLKTCDMYEALENCQILGFYDRLSERRQQWLKKQEIRFRAPFVAYDVAESERRRMRNTIGVYMS